MDSRTLQFIEQFLFDTIFVDFHYFESPFGDISAADRYLRKGLVHSEELYADLLEIFHSAENNYFYIIRDKYLLQYIVFRPSKESDDIISIGPYTSIPVDDNYFLEITKSNHLDFFAIESLKGFLYRLPLFTNNLHLIAAINDILTFINPDAGSYEIKYINMCEEEETSSDDYAPIDDFELFVDSVKERYRLEAELLDCISAGNYVEALIANKKFMSSPYEPRWKDALQNKKGMLYTANTLFRKAAEKSKVHPLYLHQISSKFAKLADQVTTIAGIDALSEKMIRDYCLLVRNKARIQYSSMIRHALNHIEFGLNSQITLSSLAKELHISPPYLSKLFKQEIGITITDYINQQRVHLSLKLLNTTDMQIQDIASYVGIHDLNYFTKIFKKQIGDTPRDYRKKVRG